MSGLKRNARIWAVGLVSATMMFSPVLISADTPEISTEADQLTENVEENESLVNFITTDEHTEGGYR